MPITNFVELMSFLRLARSMRHDLPDGQWDELSDCMEEFGIDFKTKESEVDADTLGEIISDVNRINVWWL